MWLEKFIQMLIKKAALIMKELGGLGLIAHHFPVTIKKITGDGSDILVET